MVSNIVSKFHPDFDLSIFFKNRVCSSANIGCIRVVGLFHHSLTRVFKETTELPTVKAAMAKVPPEVPSWLHAFKRAGWRVIWGFLKWWYKTTTMGFLSKNDHFGVFSGYHQVGGLYWYDILI